MESAFSCCNFALASMLKYAPFWRKTIPKEFRYHSEGTQSPFWSNLLTQKTLLSWQKLLPLTSSRVSQVSLVAATRKNASLRTSTATAPTWLRESTLHVGYSKSRILTINQCGQSVGIVYFGCGLLQFLCRYMVNVVNESWHIAVSVIMGKCFA